MPSWSFIATVGSLVALVSIVHLFFTPLLPSSLDYFEVWRAQSSCSPVNLSAGLKSEHLDGNSELGIDFDKQFPVDSHGAVTYHGAPWKAEIGKWFSGYGDVLNVVDVVEMSRTRYYILRRHQNKSISCEDQAQLLSK
ncbi:uncharacterized protein A4U43_C07F25650 [Asparagus officinalis]|uniref:Uncharacterized protein n=1 Tax=Asparagus officinalis TaxID=4686 RepID=A0A5P1EEZ6_ASPOF|nr:uncharacterized protein A4U43_C07F25650 [Asparagus officinalis]